MAKVGGTIEKAFASYGAKLVNRTWAVSAPIEGAMVMCLWFHRFKRGMLYEDRLSRWSGPGKDLFREHLQQVVTRKLPIRLVMATSSNPAAVDLGQDASKIKNSFSARPGLVGEVEQFDGDAFRLRFRAVLAGIQPLGTA